MQMKKEEIIKQEMAVYQDADGGISVDIVIRDETTRVSQKDMAKVFGIQRPAITKHLNNVFKEGELQENSVSSILEHTASDGKNYKTTFYNLDAVIAVGYRVNSSKATKFRIWATKILKEYILKGFALNQKRLEETKLNELEQVLALIKKNIQHGELSHQETAGLLNVVTGYTHSWILLQKYDEGSLELPATHDEDIAEITYKEAIKAITDMRTNFLFQQYVSELFGIERNNEFKGILEGVYQKFGGQELYPSVEEKAAHLLFFIVKNHPFADGNKKIGAFMFLWFLAKNNCLYAADGSKKIDDHTLVAITLLVATCDTTQKEMIIKLILNFLG
ncbi:MAG: RhuM family protein [Candidatus Absconditabacterales bacterium]